MFVHYISAVSHMEMLATVAYGSPELSVLEFFYNT